MNVISLFSGIGGLDAGWKMAFPKSKTILYCERDPYACGVLIKQMEQGNLTPAPIWSDITTLDAKPYRGIVDCVMGGFPCQDISVAGKGAGIKEGETRSGLWYEMRRIIGEARPTYVFLENVSAILVRGGSDVVGHLAQMGYDCRWGVVSAAEAGALHKRDRWFCIAYPNKGNEKQHGIRSKQCNERLTTASSQEGHEIWERSINRGCNNISPIEEKLTPNYGEKGIQGQQSEKIQWQQGLSWCKDVREVEDLFDRPDIPEPLLRGGSNGVSFRMDRTACLGNSVVPQQAYLAIRKILKRPKQ